MTSQASASEPHKVLFRPPEIDDGASIWKLVRDSGRLDLNSSYCYLLLCLHHRETCVLAESDGEIVGFVSAYAPPQRAETLFIWQIAVIPAFQRKGLAGRLLGELLRREPCLRTRYLEATVGPSNQASRALFTGLAQRLDCRLDEVACFSAAHFPNGDHEPEILLRIGPFCVSPPNFNPK